MERCQKTRNGYKFPQCEYRKGELDCIITAVQDRGRKEHITVLSQRQMSIILNLPKEMEGLSICVSGSCHCSDHTGAPV